MAIATLVVEMALDAGRFVSGLGGTKASVQGFARDMAAAGGVLTAVGAPIALLVNQAINAGDALDEMSQRTGFSVEALSALAPIARMSGSDIETVERAARGMTNAFGDMRNVSEVSERALNSLGLSLRDISGLSPEQQFFRIAEALADTVDPTVQLDAAMGIFGARVGTSIIPMLGDLAGGQDAVIESSRRLGVVWTQQGAVAAGLFNDALERVRGAIGSISISLVESGLLENLTGLINRVASAVVEFTRAHPVLTQVATTLGLLAAVAGPVVIAFGLFVGALGTIGAAVAPVLVSLGLASAGIGALGSAFLALTGGGAIVAAVAALGYFASANETVRATVVAVWERIRVLFATVLDGITGIVTASGNGLIQFWNTWGDELSAIFGTVWEGVKIAFDVAWSAIESIVRGALGVIEGAIQTFTGVVTLDWGTFVGGLGTIWSAIWAEIKGIVMGGVAAINNALAGMIEFFASKIAALNTLTRGMIPGLAAAAAAASGLADNLRANAVSAEAMGRQVTDTGRDMRRFKAEAEDVGDAVRRRVNPELVESSKEMKKLQEETESVIREFRNASRPADELARKIDILTRAGHSNADIIATMGGAIMSAAEAQRAHGQSIPPVVAELARQTAALNAVKAAAEADKETHAGLEAVMRSTGNGSLFLQGRIHTLTLEMEAHQAVVERLSLETKNYGEELGMIDPALASVAERTGVVTQQSATLASTISNQVSTALTDTARGLADAIVKWENFGATGLRIVQELATGIIQTLIEGALSRLLGSLDEVIARIPGLGGIFGGGGVGGGVPVPSVGGGGGGVPGGGGSTPGGAGSFLGTIGAIGSVGSAVSGVIGNFQNARMEGSLNVIALHTLETKNVVLDHFLWAQHDTEIFWDIRNTLANEMLTSEWAQERHLEDIRNSISASGAVPGGDINLNVDFHVEAPDAEGYDRVSERIARTLIDFLSLNAFGFRDNFRRGLGI